MLRMSVAQTSEIDGEPAVAALLEQCRATLGDLEPKAGLLMASHDLELEGFCDALFRIYPDLLFIGCTTIAPMSSAADYYEGASTLSLFASDTLDFSVGVGFPNQTKSDDAARDAVAQATAGSRQKPALCIAVTSVEGLDPIELTDALNRALDHDIVLFGGGATPDLPMTAMWRGSLQILNRQILSDSLPILLISGPLKISVGVGHGWTPTGREAVVTKSVTGRILEIDDKPAVEFYRHYLGETPVAALAAPLVVHWARGERALSPHRICWGLPKPALL